MINPLQNKTAIITGASNGIGMEIGKKFLLAGANVVFSDYVKFDLENIISGVAIDPGSAHSFYGNMQDKLAINFLYDLTWEQQFPFWFGVGSYEFARMGAGWKNPFVGKNTFFKLEDDYQPGNLLKLPNESYSEARLNRELSNGRLAMLGTLGYMAEELVKQHQLL